MNSKMRERREFKKPGANSRLLLMNAVLCALICIITHSLLGIPLFAVIHLLVARLSVKDSSSFNLNMKDFVMMPPVLNRWYCGKN